MVTCDEVLSRSLRSGKRREMQERMAEYTVEGARPGGIRWQMQTGSANESCSLAVAVTVARDGKFASADTQYDSDEAVIEEQVGIS